MEREKFMPPPDKQDTQGSAPKTPRLKFLIAGIVVVGIFIFVAEMWSVNREPRALGHPLSTWLAFEENGVSKEQAEVAINKIGERAIPILLKKLQAKDPMWKDSLYKLSNKIPGLSFHFSWAMDEQAQAMHGFACLGP